MRTITAPATAPAPGPGAVGPLRLADAVSIDFTADSPTAHDPDLRVFVGDMVRPYGLPLDEDQLRAGAGQSYAEMGEAVINALVGPDRPVDVLIEVFASPDVQPGRAASLHLSTFCPGRPFAFALSEQGSAGAFSALRLVRSYLAGEGFERALVIVLEQPALHYLPPDGTPLAQRATAVGLFWERTADLALTLPGDTVGLTAQEAYAQVAKAVAELPGIGTGTHSEPLLLLGAGLADLGEPAGAETLHARPGNPYTGLWSALAESLPRIRAEGRDVLLAEYDPLLGYLNLGRIQGR